MGVRARARGGKAQAGRTTLTWSLVLAVLATVLVSLSGTAAGLSERLAPAAKVSSSRLRTVRPVHQEPTVRPRPTRVARRLSRCQTRQLDVQFGAKR
jgi:hypothetical protein